MGWLTPLYLAGLAALALPLVLHLIRRTPRGRQAFSSLMFLSPSPPRLTRRSRIDHWLLLLLRLAALTLLAMAFARPFVRESALLPLGDTAGRRIAILLDVSASMKRGDLWHQALNKVESVLADIGPNDDVALFAFDDRVRTLVDFTAESAVPAASKPELVRSRLRETLPTWASTDLAAALVEVASELERTDDAQQATEPQLVLISDVQRGARTDALQAYSWPSHVGVSVHALSPRQPGNASVQLLSDEPGAAAQAPRVRVTNAADSTVDQFTLRWLHGKGQPQTGETLSTYVPPGQSRVVRLPRPNDNPMADRIVLVGDDADFDNTYYAAPPRQQHVALVYLGHDAADDPQGLQYYLRLALADDPLRKVEIISPTETEAIFSPGDAPPQLVVVSRPVSADGRDQLVRYAESGGTLLTVLGDRETADSLTSLWNDMQLGDPMPDGGEPHEDRKRFQLLGEIDFTHSLFALFADPRYGDFTKIHFWRHQPVKLQAGTTTRVVARFDNGDPAVMERATGKGRVLVFASGWRPDDSQLALSSKFVPLVQVTIDLACGPLLANAGGVVGQPLRLHAIKAASTVVVEKPNGKQITLSDAETFDQTDEPGIYRVRSGNDEYLFAVNVSSAERATTPMELEQLEQLGVRFANPLSRAQRAERLRQQRDVELEGRQKVWKWAIAAALAVLIAETWLAGRRTRSSVAGV